MIEAGTVHAIGAGVLLAEIQQMSDATFRVFDWGRVGPDGRPRELHLRQAIESTDFSRGPVNPLIPTQELTAENNTIERLSRCQYFALERLRLKNPTKIGSSLRFTILMVLDGSVDVRPESGGPSTRLGFGQTLLLPAAVGACSIIPDRQATVLTCVVP
jgi:mannose-6-phosphate isomerase